MAVQRGQWRDLPRCRLAPGVRDQYENRIETLQLDTTIGPDSVVRIEAPTHLAPRPGKVVVVSSTAEALDWTGLRGVGKEIWAGIDAQ
ncbi:MAG: hypothetical protein ACE5HV_11335 [Acidobacteriota bacterium]